MKCRGGGEKGEEEVEMTVNRRFRRLVFSGVRMRVILGLVWVWVCVLRWDEAAMAERERRGWDRGV